MRSKDSFILTQTLMITIKYLINIMNNSLYSIIKYLFNSILKIFYIIIRYLNWYGDYIVKSI